ncbi:MAG: ABC transporter permease subunit [Desulfobacteraceae bacterium]|nr:MAG: ABC transporter permease subunit [Desulfobacteraceae bacterium]
MRARFTEIFVTSFTWVSGLLFLSAAFTVIGFLLVKGIPALSVSLLFGETAPVDVFLLRRQVLTGLFPAIAGTCLLVILAVGMATPVGLAAGIYLAEYGRGSLKNFFSLFYDILAGVPSIVIGLFGFSIAIILHRYVNDIYPCLLISALALALLVLPYLIRTTQFAMESIPSKIRLTAPALGATKLQNIVYVLFPRSLPGISSGIILAIGRCAEDTAVIMLTGVVASAGIPGSLLSAYEALPFYIYYISSQYRDAAELQTGYGAAVILLVICACLFLVAFYLKNRLIERMFYSR